MFEDKKIDNEYNLKAVNYIRNIKSSKQIGQKMTYF